MLDALPEPRLLVREDRTVAYANRAFRARYGLAVVEGRRCHELIFHDIAPCERSGRSCPMLRKDCAEGHCTSQHKVPGPMGVRYIETELTPIRRTDGTIRFYMERIAESEGRAARTGGDVVAESPFLKPVLEQIGRRATDDAPVVFVGERGVGKALFARLLHENGRRAARPFVAISAQGLTADALERELLGDRTSPGLLETASGGTLFLSHVEALDPALCDTLRVLALEGAYRARGTAQVHFAQIRVVLACDRLDRTKAFPARFLYAFAPYVIRIPSLRERLADVPVIAERFVAEAGGKSLSPEASNCLLAYTWPGNLPELEAVLQTAALSSPEAVITRQAVERARRYITETCRDGSDEIEFDGSSLASLAATWRGSRAELARMLGLSERTLYRKLQALKINKGE